MIRSGCLYYLGDWSAEKPRKQICPDVTKISNVAVPIHSFINTETITNLLDFFALSNYTDKTC